jgi:hypothetical protein
MRAIVVLCVAVVAANAQSPFDIPSIVAKVSPAVVFIKGESSAGTITGSGLIVSRDGKIATNLHVIRDLRNAGVQLASGEIFDTLSVLAFDDRKDLAIIKIAGFDLPIIDLGNSNEVRSGERVGVIGSPRGLQGTVTTGVVSAVRDDPAGTGFKVIQTDASVNPGNSGGPLLNDRAQAIRIVTWKLRGSEGLNFAVPINYVRGMLEDLPKAMSLDELRVNLASPRSDIFKSSGFPTLWKSLTAGGVRSLRFEGDLIYAESVLTDKQHDVEFDSCELKKAQNGGYSGVRRVGITCSYIGHFNTGPWNNRCRFENKIEFNTITPSRIEGRILAPPDGAVFNCGKCSYSKPLVWRSFVWIPQ